MKKIVQVTVLLLFIFNTSCSSDNDDGDIDLGPDPDALTTEQQTAIDYFTEIALGLEFGTASQVTRKWLTDIMIIVEGTTTPELLTELDDVIADLNALISDEEIEIRITTDASEANFTLFMGTGAEYATFFPQSANLVASNFGLFFVNFNNAQAIISANMYVDTSRPTELKQRHLLREELTQALGLARDSARFPDSIFQTSFDIGCTTSYSNFDEVLIQLLYDNRVDLNLNEASVRIILEDIITDFI